MSLALARASTQYIYTTPPVTTTPLTMACWFLANDITTVHGLMQIYDYDDTGSPDHFTLQAGGATAGDPIQALAHLTNQGSVVAASTSGYSEDIWQHAAGVFASSTSRSAYVNGGSKGTNTTSSTPDGTHLNRLGIGVRFTDGETYNYLDGLIAEAAVWNVALTDTEVAILAQGYSPKLVRPSSLVFYTPLIRPANPSQDIKGGLSLTWNDTPTVGVHPRAFYPG